MPDMTIEIGGSAFTVACQDGEESFLRSAAEMLDREAQVLVGSGVRLSKEKMLLMAGLMLADKTISADEELRALDRRLAQQTKMIDELQARPAGQGQEGGGEALPEGALDRLDALADRAEALARKAEAA